MPCTRRSGSPLAEAIDFDDSDLDPDYRESSADEDDDLPTCAQDRADWIVQNYDAIAELYQIYRQAGQQLFGNAFFQLGDITAFAHFTYNYTTPGAN